VQRRAGKLIRQLVKPDWPELAKRLFWPGKYA
jgi:hypothetical protein